MLKSSYKAEDGVIISIPPLVEGIPACCDDDDDYDSAITPVLSTEETENSLSMGDEHLDTIPATESDEVIKSSVEDLVLIPSETKGIPDTMCDVHLNNPTPFEAKNHFETVINSKDDISSSDDDSLYENIEYVEASPHDSEVVRLEVTEIVTLEVEAIEDDNLQISSGSTTTHSDISLSKYDLFIFDFTHEEFSDKLAHIISPPKIRENLSTTSVNLPNEDDYSPLLTYVVWIFLAYLTYPVIPPYLLPFGNKDTIFDPSITINRFCSLKAGLSH
nr:hypothetical protein [Tanacetum cinerariifolium]